MFVGNGESCPVGAFSPRAQGDESVSGSWHWGYATSSWVRGRMGGKAELVFVKHLGDKWST